VDRENIQSYNILQPLLLAAAIAIGMMVGYKMNEKPENTLVSLHEYPKDSIMLTGRVEELIRFIDSKYVDKINADELIDEAVNAVFSKLDPHSVYMSPSDVDDTADQMNGAYSGIGIENYFIDDTIIISNVLGDSPAQKSELKIFDKIIEIDGEVVAGKKYEYEKIRSKLRKPTGQSLKLEILRDGNKISKTVQIAQVPVKSVVSKMLPEINAAVVKIERFGNHTYKEFMEEVERHFKDGKCKHLILDLRDNPGGYLPEAVNILCQIIEEKERLLLYTEGRNSKRNEYKSTGKRFFNIEKTIVLIDENSASASEIVAGALQDWDRGIIIGRRSYGKGLVQEQYALNNGGAIRLTVAKYFTPSGRSIQKDYSDLDKYDEDLSNRHQNGDLFYKDSSTVKNGGKYYTKVYKRLVSGNGGITPDIFIGMPEIYKDETAFEIRSFIPEFSFRYLIKHRHRYQVTNKPELIKSFEIDFRNFLMLKLKDSDIDISDLPLNGYWPDVSDHMKAYLEQNRTHATIKNDDFLKKAIEVIQQDKTPKDFKTIQ
jgi:carboxyl-terminal processing protease